MSSAPSPPTKYLFVDAGYLRRALKDKLENFVGIPLSIDWQKLKQTFLATRVFVYDCLDDVQRPKEQESDFKLRVVEQEARFAEIASISGYFVKFGVLSGTGTRRRQKEVDVQLAVDMLSHSYNKNMDIASLLAGDRDFRPVVEAVVNQGTVVQVISEKRSTSRGLTHAADAFIPLTVDGLWQITNGPNLPNSASLFPRSFPAKIDLKNPQPIVLDRPLYEGELPTGPVVLVEHDGAYAACLPVTMAYLFRNTWHFHDPLKLKAFIDLEFGPVKWRD